MKDIIKQIKKLDYSFDLENKIMQEIMHGEYLNKFLRDFVNIIYKTGFVFWTFLGLIALSYSIYNFLNSSDSEIFSFFLQDLSIATNYISEVINIIFENFAVSFVLVICSILAIFAQKKLKHNLLDRNNG